MSEAHHDSAPLGSDVRAEGPDARWVHEVRVEGAVTFRVGRAAGRLVAEWPGLATLTCAPDGSDERLVPGEHGSPRALEKLRRGYVRALVRDLGGQLGVHASAVSMEAGAVLFLGVAGAGKSTAAAELCREQGAALLADDVTLLNVAGDGVALLPSEDAHWLTPASCRVLGVQARDRPGERKCEVGTARVEAAARPLVLGVVLRFDAALTRPVFRPLRGAEGARALLEAVIRFDVEDARARRREFEQVTAVHRAAPFYELARPNDQPGRVAPFVAAALQRPAP